MDAERSERVSEQQLRWFGLVMLVFCAVVGAVLGVRRGSQTIPLALGVLGAALAGLYYALPPLRLPLFLGWMRLARPLGAALSWLLLAAVYFLAVTPIGLVGRLFGRDALRRRFDAEAESYWQPRTASRDPAHYLRQS